MGPYIPPRADGVVLVYQRIYRLQVTREPKYAGN